MKLNKWKIGTNKTGINEKHSKLNTEKSNIDLKKKKLQEITYTLINTLIRILKNDRIKELSFGFIHNLSYTITIEKGGEFFTNELEKNFKSHLQEMYEDCLKYLNINEYCFIGSIIECYNDYLNKISIIQRTLMYYEKNYLIKINPSVNLKSKSKILFENVFLNDKVSEIIKEIFLNKLESDRKNIYVEKILINQIASFLLDLNEELFINLIEQNVLIQTKEFYENEYIKNIETKNCLEYSKYVRNRLDEEANRISEFNLVRCKEKILMIFKEEFITKFFLNRDKLTLYVTNLLKTNDKENLLILKEISILNLVEDFYKLFAKAIELHICEIIKEKRELNGTESPEKNSQNSQISQNSQNLPQNNQFVISLSIIDDLLDVLDKIENFKKDFNILNKQNYLNLIKHHIQYAINNKNHQFLIAKILPRHIDNYFRRSLKNRMTISEMNTYLERIINLFRVIDDKDIFEIEYRKLLQSRLLNSFFYEELETNFLGRLKLESGAVFTHRFEVMIQDIKESVRTLENYFDSNYSHKKNKICSEIEFNIKILTQGNWIVNTHENLRIENILKIYKKSKSLMFLEILENFNLFYIQSFHNKTLNYNLMISTCDVLVKTKMRNYQISMNSFQAFMCIFIKHSKEKICLDKIFEFFGISDLKSIMTNIITIIKSGLINCNVNDLTETINKIKDKNLANVYNESNLREEFSCINFEFNKNFFNKNQIIKISNQANINNIQTYDKLESKSEESVIAERKYMIESNIIRIMKSKQIINHNDLTNEVLKSLQHSFVAELNVIKQRIESLIERGYIKREENNFNNYIYNS